VERKVNAASNVPRLVIAGTHSGVGKTTIATGIMAALRNRDFKVQPFKVGPDYIDPTYHTLATGLPSRNLDSWMLSHDTIIELFGRTAQKADISIIEGVMGLFDGHSGLDDSGSTAEVAKLLDVPTILIIDAGKMARSAAAVALGYTEFDPALNLSGFVINNIGSERHFEWVKEAIEKATSVPVLGYLPKNVNFEMPERHLGLIPTVENLEVQFMAPLCQQIEQTFEMNRLLEIARSAPPIPKPKYRIFPSDEGAIHRAPTNIAYAWDEAFSFYYQDNLDLLEAYGARLFPFSPMHDSSIPEGAQGVYIGGGFPEMYAEALSANRSILDSLKKAASEGMPIYGECGGLMYLSQGITDFEGNLYPMLGLVPGWSRMTRQLARMGYVEIEALEDTILSPKGARLRGHEFHWSEMESKPKPSAYQILHPQAGNEGYINGNILASYVHLHFGSDPNLARNFVQASRQWAATNLGP
jgi:cobyrinic acid a,c-diamide synthase